MNKIMYVLSFMFSLSSFAALVPCGQHEAELSYPDLNWEKIYTVSLKSAFGDVDTIVCGGFNSSNVKILVYRDSGGGVIKDKLENFFKSRVILSSEMLPEKAQFLVRKGKYVTFKVNRVDIRKSEKVVMEMSTGFLRNISKGVGGADYRDLVIVSEFDPNLKRFISQIKGSESPLVFDHAELKLKTFPLKINEVYFFKQGVEMEAFKTNRLPTFHE